MCVFFFSSRRRHTRLQGDWSSDVCSSDLLDLKTVFFLSSPFAATVPTDALNMANATGIPAMFWAVLWIALSVLILAVAVKQYVASQRKSFAGVNDLALDRTADVWSMPALPSVTDQVRYNKSS